MQRFGVLTFHSKLADWDDDEPATAPAAASRSDKVVVLKYMFTLEELAEDPAALQEIKEDIQDECADKFQTLGTVANVTVFDLEPDGIATVRFSTIEAANACVELMNGRHFASRTVHAYISDGDEKFKKTRQKAKGMFDAEADAVEEKRLNEFGDWIEESAK
jgi:HIV Tat-specific factor 1